MRQQPANGDGPTNSEDNRRHTSNYSTITWSTLENTIGLKFARCRTPPTRSYAILLYSHEQRHSDNYTVNLEL